jgi:hypothetical protein
MSPRSKQIPNTYDLLSSVQPVSWRRSNEDVLRNSWAGIFYKEFFCRIDEEPFEILYSDKDSRPNVPVNDLIGCEALKAGYGWSDLELYENYCYNLQVRYVLGYDRLGDGDF